MRVPPVVLTVVLVCAGTICGASYLQAAEVFQTPYVRLEYDKSHPAYVSIKIDPQGHGNYGEELLTGRGLYTEYEDAGFVWFHSYDSPGSMVVADDSHPDFQKITIRKIRPSNVLTETHTVYVSKKKPSVQFDISVQVAVTGRYRVFGKLQADVRSESPKRSVYFAGRKGLVMEDGSGLASEILTDVGQAVAGKICKDCESTIIFRKTYEAPLLNPFLQRGWQDFVWLGLSYWGSYDDQIMFTAPAGSWIAYSITADFGNHVLQEGVAGGLKETSSRFMAHEQDYVYWLSIIGTARDVGRSVLNKTAAVLQSSYDQGTKQAYNLTWLRDSFHGWHSAVHVAGPAALTIMEDTIRLFSTLNNSRQFPGLTAHNSAGDYNNADATSQLILMSYDYYSKTGRYAAGTSFATIKERADSIIRFIRDHNAFGTDLMFIPKFGGYQSYPDVSFPDPQGRWVPIIHGEQLYLNAMAYGALMKSSALAQAAGDRASAVAYRNVAESMQRQINLPVSPARESGLWDPSTGCYVNKDADGVNTDKLDSFGVFWAIETGLINDPTRAASCLRRFPLESDYYQGLSPTLQSHYFPQYNPWVAGIDVIARLRSGDVGAGRVWGGLFGHYHQTRYPFREAFVVGDTDYNADENRARIWDSWGFLAAIYMGHYGITMTPTHLSILPHPLAGLDGDFIRHLRWQDSLYNIQFAGSGNIVQKYQINGTDWYSSVLPRGNATVNVYMGPAASTPLVVGASPMIAVTAATYDSSSPTHALRLVVQGNAGGGPEELLIRYPRSLGIPAISQPANTPAVTGAYDATTELFRVLVDFTAASVQTIEIADASHWNPIGWHDTSSCAVTTGWTCDPSDFVAPVTVHFYSDTGYIGQTVADQVREPAVGAHCGGYVHHGFSFATPAHLQDGLSHPIAAYAINVGAGTRNSALNGTPKTITCVPPPAPLPPPPSANTAPVVTAGPDQTITLPAAALVQGVVSDDGLPAPSQVSVGWTFISGPGSVSLGVPTSVTTTATFSQPGAYVLRLTATDGALTTSDDLTLIVQPVPDTTPPMVHLTAPAAGALVSGTVRVEATASDAVGVVGLQFYLDGQPLGLQAHEPYYVTWETWWSTDSPHTLTAQAWDAAGNLTTSPPISVTVLNHPNQAPTVHAGADQAITLPVAVRLHGAIVDDGLPNPPGRLTASWMIVSGPGAVTFADAAAATTTATFSEAGTYLLRLTAHDSDLQTADDVIIAVSPAPDTTPPTVTLVAPQPGATVRGLVTLEVLASDNAGVAVVQCALDEQPLGAELLTPPYRLAWDTTLVPDGGHTLTVHVRDVAGNVTSSPPIVVTVDNYVNQPPQVQAGADYTITLPAGAALQGDVQDDGWPNPPGHVTVTWSVLSGPGAVSFGSSTALTTPATFSHAGEYLLRLTGSDGALTASDHVTITVQPVPDTTPPPVQLTAQAWDAAGNVTTSPPIPVIVLNHPHQPPSVDAGTNQTVTLPSHAALDGTVADDGLPHLPGQPLSASEDVALTVQLAPDASPPAVSVMAPMADLGGTDTPVLGATATDSVVTVSNIANIIAQPPPSVLSPTVTRAAPAADAAVSELVIVPTQASDAVDVAHAQFLLNEQPVGAEVIADPKIMTAAGNVDPVATVTDQITNGLSSPPAAANTASATDGTMNASHDVVVAVQPALNISPPVSVTMPVPNASVDGGTSTQQQQFYTYRQGNAVYLMMPRARGAKVVAMQTMRLNAKPVAVMQVLRQQGRTVTFTSDGTSDPDATPADELRYTWYFGDGARATLPQPTHTYRRRGTYVVRLQVAARDGATAAARLRVTVP